MRKMLLFLAVLLGVAVFNLPQTASASHTHCSATYCATAQYCICPPGTPAATRTMPCGTWYADCHYW